MPGLTVAESFFVSNALGGIFYGIYCVIFIQYLTLLNKSKANFNRLVYPLFALFILGTAFMGIAFAQGFFYLLRPNTVQTEVTLFRLRLCTSTIYTFLDLISQGVLIYRCWTMWSKKLILIVIPSILSIASFATDIVLIVELVALGPTAHTRPAWYRQLGTASFSISLATNTIVTAILILRLVMVHREVDKNLFGQRHYLATIISMLIESAALTFLSQLLWVVLFSLQDVTTGFDAIDVVTALSCGIAPTAVIVRVAMGRSYEARLTNVVETTMRFSGQSGYDTSIATRSTASKTLVSRITEKD